VSHVSGSSATLAGHKNLIICICTSLINYRHGRGKGWFGNNHHRAIVIIWH
jgi:hypothetical protein